MTAHKLTHRRAENQPHLPVHRFSTQRRLGKKQPNGETTSARGIFPGLQIEK
ncbi:hypothetical protein RHGRI_020914 [Rhododendron griersonianum]|uniref:Uncharacterized protein n=1 Tax=Rhododendron griersonianum TaxID=479676 RepID=A0AAV6JMG3_9ERIC|nr:hypothetical protein RHGRI_020914 [Rhododendron griersonianum]